jgi:hypothetical protein
MLHALDLGMLNGDYAFLTVNLLPSAAIGNNTWMGNDGRDNDALLAFRGILSIHVREPTTERWQEFKKEVRRRMQDPPFYITLADSEKVSQQTIFLLGGLPVAAKSEKGLRFISVSQRDAEMYGHF